MKFAALAEFSARRSSQYLVFRSDEYPWGEICNGCFSAKLDFPQGEILSREDIPIEVSEGKVNGYRTVVGVAELPVRRNSQRFEREGIMDML